MATLLDGVTKSQVAGRFRTVGSSNNLNSRARFHEHCRISDKHSRLRRARELRAKRDLAAVLRFLRRSGCEPCLDLFLKSKRDVSQRPGTDPHVEDGAVGHSSQEGS